MLLQNVVSGDKTRMKKHPLNIFKNFLDYADLAVNGRIKKKLFQLIPTCPAIANSDFFKFTINIQKPKVKFRSYLSLTEESELTLDFIHKTALHLISIFYLEISLISIEMAA